MRTPFSLNFGNDTVLLLSFRMDANFFLAALVDRFDDIQDPTHLGFTVIERIGMLDRIRYRVGLWSFRAR
jgi:hypothetical protein